MMGIIDRFLFRAYKNGRETNVMDASLSIMDDNLRQLMGQIIYNSDEFVITYYISPTILKEKYQNEYLYE